MSNTVTGVVKTNKNGTGFLRDPAESFRSTGMDIIVPAELIRKYKIPEGATVTGHSKRKGKRLHLESVTTICEQSPEEFKKRTSFTSLTPLPPEERFHLAESGKMSMRIIDIFAPIGKGTRGLIVSPPKAGKTFILKDIAQAIRQTDKDTRVIVLLIDERPEEVTDFQREVDAEVFSSTNDRSVREHVDLTRLVLSHVRVELECGRDVVVLVDSLTRMARAFNSARTNSGRTLSGGLDARAMETPRKFFGMARNIEHGGSVTIIATALVDTGSRMDQLIFEEFKGTGNSEIVLDRSLADSRIFPAINLPASGTRREELLYNEESIRRIALLRRVLLDRDPRSAMDSLITQLKKHPTNKAFLESIPDKK